MTTEMIPDSGDLIVAYATSDGHQLTDEHFGSAHMYVLHRCSKHGCVFVANVANTTIVEHHDGDSRKATSVRDLLASHGVAVAVARYFGPNIKRIRRDVVPLITDVVDVADAATLLARKWDEVLLEWSRTPEQRMELKLDRGANEKGRKKPVIRIDKGACVGCVACVSVCPVDAIEMDGHIATVDSKSCIICGACVATCPVGAIAMD